MVHEKNWRVSLCVQELCHAQPFRYFGMARVTPHLLVIFIFIWFLAFGWFSQQLFWCFRRMRVSPFLPFHFHMKQLKMSGVVRQMSLRKTWDDQFHALKVSWMLKKTSLRKKLVVATKTAGVSSKTFIVKKISNSLTSTVTSFFWHETCEHGEVFARCRSPTKQGLRRSPEKNVCFLCHALANLLKHGGAAWQHESAWRSGKKSCIPLLLCQWYLTWKIFSQRKRSARKMMMFGSSVSCWNFLQSFELCVVVESKEGNKVSFWNNDRSSFLQRWKSIRAQRQKHCKDTGSQIPSRT